MRKLNDVLELWPWMGNTHHLRPHHFTIFQKKTSKIKNHLEQDQSNSILPYHISQQPRNGSCFSLRTSFKLKFDYASQLTQKLKQGISCMQDI
jgi:hypothetical protein